MSTVVDNADSGRARRSSAETRTEILRVAGLAFSRTGYDNTGVREIGNAAGCDPAVVIRVFGSKAQLFAEIAANAFAGEAVFDGPADSLARRLAAYLTQPATADDVEVFDDLQFLLRSASSPEAAPMVSQALHRAVVAPLAATLGGKDAPTQAALVVSLLLGFATMKFALGSVPLNDADATGLAFKLGRALRACY